MFIIIVLGGVNIKILHVTPTYAPAWSSGGIARVSYTLCNKLSKKGYDIVVYTSDIGVNKKNNAQNNPTYLNNVKVYYFKRLLNSLFKKINLKFTPGVLKHLNEKNIFDIVHIHGNRTFQNILVYEYVKRYNIPYVVQAHGSIPRVGACRKLKWFYDLLFGHKLLTNASKVIALNQTEAEQYRSMGVQDEKIKIIPNGIDLTEYNDLPPRGSFKEKYNIPLENKVILYLGRIHQSKGIALLIKSFSLLMDRMKYGSTILVLIGPDDGYMDEAKSLVDSLGILDSVLFTGFVSAEDKRKALVDADIFVTPSFSGFPMTFLEACATGTPIITTTLGDNLEWIDGKTGYVVLPTSSDIADTVFKLLTDDDLRDKLSENCRDIVKSDFSLEKVIEKMNQVYEKVTGLK
ncbi:MAG: glycosyltransferase family 4 protein [Candidatus Odinarchaeia archaeon]